MKALATVLLMMTTTSQIYYYVLCLTETNLKTGQHFAKSWAEVWWKLFFTRSSLWLSFQHHPIHMPRKKLAENINENCYLAKLKMKAIYHAEAIKCSKNTSHLIRFQHSMTSLLCL